MILLTFFTPFLIATFFFLKAYLAFIKLLRKIENPDYPLLPNEAKKFFGKNQAEYLKRLPILPFILWKNVFRSYKEKSLQQAAKKTQKFFWVLIFVMIVNFVIHFFVFILL